jgi:hypothetical protein
MHRSESEASPPSAGPSHGADLSPRTTLDRAKSSLGVTLGAKSRHDGSTLDCLGRLMTSLWNKKLTKVGQLKNIPKKYCHDTLQDLKKYGFTYIKHTFSKVHDCPQSHRNCVKMPPKWTQHGVKKRLWTQT